MTHSEYLYKEIKEALTMSKENRYKKINPVIEAIQWTNEPGNFEKILSFCGAGNFGIASPLVWEQSGYTTKTLDAELKTPDGTTIVPLGNFVVKHKEGCFYPVSESCFNRLYKKLTP